MKNLINEERILTDETRKLEIFKKVIRYWKEKEKERFFQAVGELEYFFKKRNGDEFEIRYNDEFGYIFCIINKDNFDDFIGKNFDKTLLIMEDVQTKKENFISQQRKSRALSIAENRLKENGYSENYGYVNQLKN